ncbi:MAG: hypothetical protein AB1791_00120 [Chloroflexota bacterium]
MAIIDALKPIHQGIYFVLWSLASYFWDFDRILLTTALWLNSLREFIIANAALLVELVAEALVSPAGLLLTFAFVLYGFWRLVAILLPNTTWKPIELPKVVIYGFLMAAFFSTPAVLMTGLEHLRGELAEGIKTAVIESLAPSFTPAGYSSSEPGLVVYDIDGYSGISGIDLAASLVGVSNVVELGSPGLPAAFQNEYFTYGTPADFTLDDEEARTAALTLAGEGVLVMLLAPVAIFYAIGEALLWLVLTAAGVILWVGLPIALMLASFQISEGLFTVFFNRYANLWIETVISAALLGIVAGVMVEAASQGFGLFLAAGVLAGFAVLWRILSAARLASAAVNTIGGAGVTGGVTLGEAAGTVATGATAVAGGLVTGGLTAAAVAAGGAMITAGAVAGGHNANAAGGQAIADDQSTVGATSSATGLTGAKVAALGGLLLSRSRTAQHTLQAFQEVRLLAGLHSANQPDAIDAAYIGSLLAGRGSSSTYLTLGLMGGPLQAYRKLGLAPGAAGGAWGVDEEGQNPADWDRERAGGGRRPSPGPARPPRPGSGLQPEQESLPRRPAVAATEPVPEPPGQPVTSPPPADQPVTFTGQAEGVSQWADMMADPTADGATRTTLLEVAEQASGPAVRQVARAIDHYGPAPIRAAAQAIAQQVQVYQAAGRSNPEILQMFRDGRAYEDLAGHLAPDSPLQPNSQGYEALKAVADMTLAARSHVSRDRMVTAIGTAAERPAENPVDVLSSELGAPAGMGGYTGLSQAIVDRVRQMGVPGTQLVEADRLLQQGDEWAACEALQAAGRTTDAEVQALIADLDVLPAGGLEMPQTVRFQPGSGDSYRHYQEQLQEEG